MSWLLFFVAGPGVGLTASLALFGGALVTLHGRSRWLLWGPGTVLAFVVGWTVLSVIGQGNLWPLPMMTFGLLCSLLTAGVWCAGLIEERGRAAWLWCLLPVGTLACMAVVLVALADGAAVGLSLALLPFSFAAVVVLAGIGILLPKLLMKWPRFRGIIKQCSRVDEVDA